MISTSHLLLLGSLLGNSFVFAVPSRLQLRDVPSEARAAQDAAFAAAKAAADPDPYYPFSEELPIRPYIEQEGANDAFPPSSHLGYGFDLTSLVPLDLKTVCTSAMTRLYRRWLSNFFASGPWGYSSL